MPACVAPFGKSPLCLRRLLVQFYAQVIDGAFGKKEIPMENTTRDYAKLDLKDLIETVIEDAKKAGTINYPLRTNGYHQCSNLVNTDRLSY